MSDSNQQSSGIDSRFILTIILIGVVWMGWQSYLAKKYPPKKEVTKVAETANKPTAQQVGKDTVQTQTTAKATQKPVVPKPEQTLKYSNGTWSFVVSSLGMSIRNVQLNKYSNRKNKNIRFAYGHDFGLFSTELMGKGQPIDFNISQSGPNTFIGQAQIGKMTITKRIVVSSKRYTFSTDVEVANAGKSFKGLVTTTEDKIPPAIGGFFAGRFAHEEFFVDHDGSISRTIIDPKKYVNESYNRTVVTGYGSQYFAIGLFDRSPISPNLQFWSDTKNTPTAVTKLRYESPNQASDYKISYVGFAGPKSYYLLKSIAPQMTGLINFGFFTKIATWIFMFMTFIHSFIPNWGWAIIVLTFLVRLVVAPFNILSYKQMKAMGRIQPQIKALRETYKNDSQKLNQEMMKLMRENKANPIGGCLPMFLQIPIFFALYEVIGQSIELYKAPFIFWIHDLSAKDPFYVVPILMGVAMWAQQKITPNTMDPSQQKIMQFMPLIFTAMTVQLPSGLTLYIFVSSLFGFLQQYYFTKENKKQLSVVHA